MISVRLKEISGKVISLLSVLMIVCWTFSLQAQLPQISPNQAQTELDKRGITEEEVKARMKQKGYDLDNIDPANTEEVAKVQKVLEETIAELEAEKGQASIAPNSIDSNSTNSSSTSSSDDELTEAVENIEDAVGEGASLEDAIAEEFAESIQEKLPPSNIWGQNLFRDKSLKLYTRSEDATPPPTYVLGAGDRINVSIWGMSRADFNLEVKQDGYIYPTNMDRIYLKGFSLEKAKSLLENRFSRYFRFRSEEFQADINFVRTITVNIFGESNIYGSFNIPATNTAFNALVAVGGPSEIGSVRKIELRRGGDISYVDVYKFMNDPSTQYDYFLQNNDIIFVPIAERLIEIRGSVKRPFIYELIGTENLQQLIDFAGGLTVNAYQKEIQIKRIIDDEEVIIDVPMKELFDANKDFELLNGDVVTIKGIPKPYENFVEIIGAVELPGKYALREGMRLNDLINKGVLEQEARVDFAYLYRKNDDGTSSIKRIDLNTVLKDNTSSENLFLKSEDRLITYKKAKFSDLFTVSIQGAIREPATYPYDASENITVEDLIFLSGGLLPNATDFAYIRRSDRENSEKIEYITVNLQEALNSPSDILKNPILQPFDNVYIANRETYTDNFTVSVEGAVRAPGTFQYGEALSVKNLLTLAGGLQFGASSSRIEIYRLEVKENEPTQTVVATVAVDQNLNVISGDNFKLEPLDKIYVRTVPNFELQQFLTINGEVMYPGKYALVSKNERLLDIIKRAGGLTIEAFPEGAYLVRTQDQPGQTIINLDKVIKNPKLNDNIILKQGDIITIPKSLELVSIDLSATLAAELYPNKIVSDGRVNVPYHAGKRAKWYINEYAAGIDRSKRAKRRLITVEHPNKRLDKFHGFLLLGTPKVSRGSTISVGVKPKKEKDKKDKEERESIDWDVVLTQVLAVTSVFSTMVIAITRL